MKNEIKSESAPAQAGGHTPLPWLLTDGLVYRDTTGRHVTQQLCHEYGRAALMLTHDGSEEGYANAELAKAACNSYTALLAERDGLKDLLLHTQRMAIEVAEERDRMKTTLRLCLRFLESAAMLNRQAFDTCAWETLRDAAALRAEGVRAALEGGKPQPKLKTAAALRVQDLKERTL